MRFNWEIGGEAGYGIMTAGVIFSRVFSRGGYHVLATSEYPSLIRGGHNVYRVSVDEDKIHAQNSTVDVLAALNRETVEKHLEEISKNGALIYDPEFSADMARGGGGVKLYPVPLERLAKEAGKEKIMMNSVAIGASIGVIGYEFEALEAVLRDTFRGKKGKEIADINIKAARAGYDHVNRNSKGKRTASLKPVAEPKMLLNGNDALCLGALRAGCKFAAIYPMTPITSILHFMASAAVEYGLVVVQPEDEISGILQGLGASYAGVRSMVATSGGGFSLMVEALGLAGSAEIPLVIVEGQRPGPSTGMPTWTEQGDLKFVINASQGDFPRVVIAPGDAEECFHAAFNAFNIAEKYQMPVVILTDKYPGESYSTIDGFDLEAEVKRCSMLSEEELEKLGEYRRYRFTDSGVSPRSIPPQKFGIHLVKGEEHDEFGNYCEDKENRRRMMEKRMGKLSAVHKELPAPRVYGDSDAKVTLVGWGSTKGPILEALKLLERDGIKARFLHLVYVHPFPGDKVKEFLSTSEDSFIVENNFSAQMAGIIRENTGIAVENRVLKFDGRQFYPGEIYSSVRGALHA